MATVEKMALVVLMCFMVASVSYLVNGAVTCQMVMSSLLPCAYYLTTEGPVPPSCCSWLNSLYRSATTTTDRQTACRCMEQAARMVPGLLSDAASSLPGKCGVNIPYRISPTIDCSRVQ